MKCRRDCLSLTACCGLVLALLASPAAAQVNLGRIDLTVEDETGAVLPGAAVAIMGPEDRSDVFTDIQGEAHLLRLPVGTYEVRVTLQGFREYLDTAVQVRAAGSTPVTASLSVGGVAETVVVSGEAPIIDPRRQSTDTHVTTEELQEIPSARDPWVVLQTIPGIIVDRVNVGGAESGQQSNFMAKGADNDENTWTLDGVTVTDMASLSSPGYWDFDMFQEMRINTGGADVRNQTAGASVDLVLKSGTNQYHGSLRGYFAGESWQRNNLSEALADSIGGETGKGNRMEQYADYGFEVGGPLVEDRLWAWGSWGETDVRLRTIIDTADRTTLTNRAVKIQAQATDGMRLGFNHFNGAKVKLGRNAGPTRPDLTTWNQGGSGKGLFTGSANWVFGNDLVVTAKGTFYNSGFFLTPRGGLDVEGVYRDVNRVYHNSFVDYRSWRPQRVADVNANYFRGDHELKVGFGWRKFGIASQSVWPGTGQLTLHLGSYPQNGLMLPIIFSDAVRNNEGRYLSFYASDTISMDRLTVDIGVRVDRSVTSALEASRGANSLVPNVLPALTAAANPNTHSFNVPVAAHRHELRARRELGHPGPGELRAVRLAVGGGRLRIPRRTGRLLVRLLPRDRRQRRRAGARERVRDRPAGIVRLRSQRSDGPEHRQPHLARSLVPPDPRAHLRRRPGAADPQLGPHRLGDLPQVHQLQVVAADRDHLRRLRRGRTRSPPCCRRPAAAGRSPRDVYAPLPGVELPPRERPRATQQRGLQPGILGLGDQLHQAAEQPVDGPDRLLLQRSPGVLPESGGGHHRSDAVAHQPAGGRRPRHHLHQRQRQVVHLLRDAEVPVHRQRALPGAVRHQHLWPTCWFGRGSGSPTTRRSGPPRATSRRSRTCCSRPTSGRTGCRRSRASTCGLRRSSASTTSG